jgi:YD repeat-containing protein
MPVTAVVTDANGNLVTEYDYDLWGNRTRIQGAQDFNLGFTGHWVIKDLVLAPLRNIQPLLREMDQPRSTRGKRRNQFVWVCRQLSG